MTTPRSIAPSVRECEKLSQRYLRDSFLLDGDYNRHCSNTIYQKNIAVEEVTVVSKQICKQWSLIQNTLFDDKNVPVDDLISARNQICQLFDLILENVCVIETFVFYENLLQDIILETKRCHSFILPVSELEPLIVAKIARTAMNNARCPVYIYLHTYLDMQHSLLHLDYLTKKPVSFVEEHLQTTMRDIIYINRLAYQQQEDKASMFFCDCIKKFWLSLQFFAESRYNAPDMFWQQFNSVLADEDPVCAIWLLKNIAYLNTLDQTGKDLGCYSNRISPNFSLLEAKLRDAITKYDKKSLSSCLRNMSPLLNELWLKTSKIEVFQVLWDYFSKKLDYQSADNIHKYTKTVVTFSDFIDTILWCSNNCEEDFYIFISSLVIHLRQHSEHWAKIKGRIYSQLSPHKVKDLNIDGIFNVLVLYTCLSTIYCEDLTKKILCIIEVLPNEKAHTEVVWNIYIYLMMKHISDGKTIDNLSKLMVQMLMDAATDSNKFWLIKIFMIGFENIIENSPNLQLNQSALLETWLCKYSSTCYHSDLNYTINVLIKIIDQAKATNAWADWEEAYKEYVYTVIKQTGNSSSAPVVVGKLGAKLSLLCPNLSSDLFNYFNSESISPKVSTEFLCEFLADYPSNCILSSSQENMVLQSWVKACVLTLDKYDKLTSNVIKIDIFPHFIRNKVIISEDPFISFIELTGFGLQEHIKSNDIIKLCDTCFGLADRWITHYFAQPDNEGIVTRIYTTMALTFIHCGPFLYDRNKTSCPLTRLITALLLPTEFMIGKPLNPIIANAIKKTWHLYLQAIVKLNQTPDAYLDRILRDLVVKYLPCFCSSDSPLLKCVDTYETAAVVLDKVSTAFFKHPTKESDLNVSKALKMINDYVQSTTSIDTFRLLIQKTLHNLFEVVIFHNQRNNAVSVIKNITISPLYEHVKIEVNEALVNITEKHMAFNTIGYFQLMTVLAKFIPKDISSVMPRLNQHMVTIERMRGVGNDKVLRLHYEKLQTVLKNESY